RANLPTTEVTEVEIGGSVSGDGRPWWFAGAVVADGGASLARWWFVVGHDGAPWCGCLDRCSIGGSSGGF
ncbi:hypothetical protein Dimus_035885, partial [Dionaea muscipula]